MLILSIYVGQLLKKRIIFVEIIVYCVRKNNIKKDNKEVTAQKLKLQEGTWRGPKPTAENLFFIS